MSQKQDLALPHQYTGEQHRCAPAVPATNNIVCCASTDSDSFDLTESGNSLCFFYWYAYTPWHCRITAAMTLTRVGAMVQVRLWYRSHNVPPSTASSLKFETTFNPQTFGAPYYQAPRCKTNRASFKSLPLY